ncbi:hypothetical protein ACF0H5_007041 [Mactra antiquata]
MTIEKCVHDCTLQNYLFAGLEFGNQCYCGNNLEKYETKADSECSTNCAGDASQKCGATWRISVYSTKSNYLGCFEDKPARILEGSVITTSTMTTKKCLADCKAAGKRFALTEHSDQCFCGNHLKRYNKKLDHLCDYSCAGNSNEKCGGPVYSDDALYENPQDATKVVCPDIYVNILKTDVPKKIVDIKIGDNYEWNTYNSTAFVSKGDNYEWNTYNSTAFVSKGDNYEWNTYNITAFVSKGDNYEWNTYYSTAFVSKGDNYEWNI